MRRVEIVLKQHLQNQVGGLDFMPVRHEHGTAEFASSDGDEHEKRRDERHRHDEHDALYTRAKQDVHNSSSAKIFDRRPNVIQLALFLERVERADGWKSSGTVVHEDPNGAQCR